MTRLLLAFSVSTLLLLPSAARSGPADSTPSIRPHWVFFRDHGTPQAEQAARLEAQRVLLHPRRLERLQKRAPEGPLIRENDLAVPEEYAEAVAATGATIRQRSRWFDAVSVEATPEELDAIRGLPFVRDVRRVAGWHAAQPEAQPAPAPARVPGDARSLFYGPSLTQLALIRADALQDSGYTGDGIIVAMLDSGFKKTHPAFAHTRLLAEHDFVKHDGDTQDGPNDAIGQQNHGTGTWAVVGGYAPENLIGFAPFADFVLAKTEDVPREVPIEEDNWVAGAEWADSLGADVISSSLAYRDFTGTVNDYSYVDMDGQTTVVALGAREAVRRGIVVVTAMGNEGNSPETIWSPADADSAVSVGAVDASRVVAGFSSNGPTSDGRIKPEVCALGVNTQWADAPSDFYGGASGTSLSTPCVAGGVALLLEAHPSWTPGQVLMALRVSSNRYFAPDNSHGYGIPDLAKASYFGGTRSQAHRPWPFALASPVGTSIPSFQPTFLWHASHATGGAVTYRLEIDGDPAFASPVAFSGITDTTFTPAEPLPVSGDLFWRVTAVAPDGKERAAYFDQPVRLYLPSETAALGAPAPNPFGSSTSISFTVPGSAGTVQTSLRVYDTAGRLVRTLRDARLAPGPWPPITWDGKDENGKEAPSGIYFLRLKTPSAELSRRLVRIRSTRS